MSTTSKLEEAEHKVQSLQTGVMFFILVEFTQGRLKLGSLGDPPGPSRSPLTPAAPPGAWRSEVSPRSPEHPQLLYLDFISHPH